MFGFDQRTLALLAAVRRAGTISGGAALLGLDASNARRHLLRAEERLGLGLVEAARGGATRGSARLTPAAARLLGGKGKLCTVGTYDALEGVTEVRTAGLSLWAAGRCPPGAAWLEVRPEDVVLQRERAASSARNALPARVLSLREEREGVVRVRLRAGPLRLDALVTKGALRELRLRPGSRVVASVKASALRVEPA